MLKASSITSFASVIMWAGGLVRGEFALIPCVMLGATIIIHWVTKE